MDSSDRLTKTNKKILMSYISDYKKETILAPAFKMLEAIFELFVPLVVASIIDYGIKQHHHEHIYYMCLLMLLLALIGLSCSVTAQYFAAKSAVGSCTRLRQDLFSHIMNLDYAGIDRIGPSTLLTRLSSDVKQVQNGINLTLRLFLRSPFIVFGAMIMAFTIDPGISLIFAGAIVLLFIVVFGVMFITRPIYRKVQGGLDEILSITRENLTGVRVIRAFRMEEEERDRFHRSNERLTGLQKQAGRISGLLNPLTTVIINYAIIILIYQGAIKVEASVLSVGQVVALYNYMSQILVELIKLANLIVTMTRANACYGRIVDVFQEKPAISYGNLSAAEVKGCGRNDSGEPAGKDARDSGDFSGMDDKGSGQIAGNAVEFDDVSFTYEGGGDSALSHISFCAKEGETWGIIGGTGSGKSTLIQLIPRFYDATEGSIRLFGHGIEACSSSALTELVSLVPQKAQLFKGTIRENLTLGAPEASEEALRKALEVSQAEEFVDQLPEGLDAPVAQGGKNYSGGQKQRLTIARALVRKSPILILDDSASALDYATDANLRRAIHESEAETTVFIVSQRASSVMGADRILVLHDGMIAGQGTHEELLDQCEVYREIYYSQIDSDERRACL